MTGYSTKRNTFLQEIFPRKSGTINFTVTLQNWLHETQLQLLWRVIINSLSLPVSPLFNPSGKRKKKRTINASPCLIPIKRNWNVTLERYD